MHETSAAGTIACLADQDSFQAWPWDVTSGDPLDFSDSRSYRDRLAEARTETGATESVRAGSAAIDGIPVALLVSEFGFVGGSIGAATGELIARTFERALRERLPVIAVTRSGGTRMQEGNHGFVQIAKTLDAVRRFRESGLAYLVYLAHPTMGGVLASWGSRGHLLLAEPGALIGFAGPRGTEAVTGSRLTETAQRAETLAARGLVDAVVPPERLREHLAPVLRVTHGGAAPDGPERSSRRHAVVGTPDDDGWDIVLRSRDPGRPGARELLAAVAGDATYLHGDGQGAPDDPAISALLCTVAGTPAMVIAQDRAAAPAGSRPGPDGYRKARRAIALAAELRLPLVTVVDTSGAELSGASEAGGLSHQLARCLTELLAVRTPVLSVLLGEGGGGGALALLCGDEVLACEASWLAPISPEAAAAIVFGDAARAGTVARRQRVTASRLRSLGLVDEVVAGTDALAAAIGTRLPALLSRPEQERAARRHDRYRRIGNASVHETGIGRGGTDD